MAKFGLTEPAMPTTTLSPSELLSRGVVTSGLDVAGFSADQLNLTLAWVWAGQA